MTDLREAAQQALEAWQTATYGHPSHHKATLLAMTALRATLAQQDEPVQEPVAWMCSSPELMAKGYKRFSSRCEGDWNIPVYAAPPQRKPLTEEEIDGLVIQHAGYGRDNFYAVARAVERAHGIKE